ncbi:MAG: hypothetical protein WB502_12965 [Thermoactinomyces sp.]|jgi:hypothetical protein
MSQRNRDDYFNYTKPGEFVFLEVPCEKCKYEMTDPEICKKYPQGKPMGVRRAEEDCPEFEEKKERKWKNFLINIVRSFKK